MSTRTRSRSTFASQQVSTTKILADGSTLHDYYTTSQWEGKSEVMSDFVTPHFSRQRNAGVLINSPMERLVVTASPPKLYPTSWIWIKKAPPPWGSTEVVGFSCPDPIGLRFGRLAFPDSKMPTWNETAAGIALAQARSQASSADSQLLVSLGEAKETLNMLGGAVNLLLKRTEPFKVLRRRYESGKLTYRDFLVEIANLDLLVRYGVMPLIYDIQGMVKALTEPTKPSRRTARAVYRDEGSSSWSQTASSSMVASIQLSHSLTWTREYRATCLYEAEDDLQSRLGLRPADVPVAAWELVRLSFVADWFANIGDFLGSLTLAGRASVALQCVVERTTAQYIALYNESGANETAAAVSSCSSNGSASKVSMAAVRTVRRPYPTSDPGVLSARIKLSPQRILDGLALLATTMDISSRKRSVRI